MKPIWLLFLINFLIDNQNDYKLQSIDNLINLKGRMFKKHIRSIEEVDDQCRPLDDLNLDQVSTYLNHTLNDYFSKLHQSDEQSNSINQLIEQYKCGQLNNSSLYMLGQSMNRKIIDDDRLDLINSIFQRRLIDERNGKISERINLELKRNRDKNLLFVLGAAHFLDAYDSQVNDTRIHTVYSNSVIKILETKYNYRIEKINKPNLIRR